MTRVYNLIQLMVNSSSNPELNAINVGLLEQPNKHKTKVILVQDTLILSGTTNITLDIRGIAGDSYSAIRISELLIEEYVDKYIHLETEDDFISGDLILTGLITNGIDETNRVSLKLDLQLKK